MFKLLAFLLLLLSVTAAQAVVVEDGEEGGRGGDAKHPLGHPPEHPPTQIPPQSDGAEVPDGHVQVTQTVWTAEPQGELTSGAEGELLMLLRNGWTRNITLLSVAPSFRDPLNLGRVLRNMTANRIHVEIEPGQEMTLSYRLKPDMDPVTVGLNLVINFTDERKQRLYRVTAYSDVINIVAAPGMPLDVKTVILYGVLACIGLFALQVINRRVSKK